MTLPDATEFRRGARAALALVPPVAGFGLVVGIAAGDVGFTLAQALGFSVVVFAGAAQLAALELLEADGSLVVVALTAVVVNLRFLMYSASLATYFREYADRWQAAIAYPLTDQSYALSVDHYRAVEPDDPRGFYLGVAVLLWAVWQAATVAGVLAGTGIPERLGATFAVPLVFLALLVPAMKDRSSIVAAAVGGVAAAAAAGVPFDLGLLVGAAAGVTAGLLAPGGGPA